jgi:Glycosyltransferase family 87
VNRQVSTGSGVAQPRAASGSLGTRQYGRRRARVPDTAVSPSSGPPVKRRAAAGAAQVRRPRLIVLAMAGLALAVRLYLLSRVRYLTGITEYDDGVYLGGAVNLVSGAVPYRDFAFVQPPGILLLMAPVALLAKVASVSAAMTAARLLTAVASAACVALAGSLVRHRGTFVILVTCGLLAVYPADISTAHTLLLEPWMNLLALCGARLAFRRGRLAPPRRLLWAGAAFGLAGAVKYWAVIPALALFVVCLLADGKSTGSRRARAAPAEPGRRAVRFTCGVAAGFALPVLPFAAADPGTFIRSTLLDQASRAGSAVPESLRLASLTGLTAWLNEAGRLTVSAGTHSMFALGDVTAAASWATRWLPVLAAIVGAAALALGYAAGTARARDAVRAARPAARVASTGTEPGATEPAAGRGPGPLEWYALGTLTGTTAAVLAYSAFFYHYPDLPAPWLAIAAGYAAGALRDAYAGRPAGRRRRAPGAGRAGRALVAGAAAVFLLAAAFESWQLSGLHAPDVRANAALIPPGACVVTDEISLAIAANRFTAGSAGCPDVLDSLAVTLVAGHGVSVQGGAQALPQVTAEWRDILSRASYVWLSSSSDRRIAWTPGLRHWFTRRFRPLHPPAGEFSAGQVYVRRG